MPPRDLDNLDKFPGHDSDAPDLPDSSSSEPDVILGPNRFFESVDPEEPAPAPLPENLFAGSFGINELDEIRDRVKAGLNPASDIEHDAYLLHNLRSYTAAHECGRYITDNIALLQGKRNPRIVYPASARDLSILGLAEQLLTHIDVDEVYLILTEAYEEKAAENHTINFGKFLYRYAEIRGEGFEVTEDVGNIPPHFVLAVKGKRINIELRNHDKEAPLASKEELGECDVLFFHDLDGAYEHINTLVNILRTVQQGAKDRRIPLLIVDDLPKDIWNWFGNVVFRTNGAYGHRGPRSLTADPAKRSIEVGASFQRGLVVQPHAAILELSEEAFLRYLSFAFYAYFVSREPESYEEWNKKSLADKTCLNFIASSSDGADDIKAFAEIAELPQEILSNGRLETMILPFLRKMERVITSRLEDKPFSFPWLDRKKEKPPLSKKLNDAYEQRRAAIRSAIKQLEILCLDFILPNIQIRGFKNLFRLPFNRAFPNYPKALLELLDDETFVLFLRTLVVGMRGIIDPSVQDKNPPIFPDSVMNGLTSINAALKKRHIGTLNDKIKEILLMTYFASRKKHLDREIRLFGEEAPNIMKALAAAKSKPK